MQQSLHVFPDPRTSYSISLLAAKQRGHSTEARSEAAPASGGTVSTDIRAVRSFTNKQKALLLRAGFNTTTELLFTPPVALSEKLKIPPQECRAVLDSVVLDKMLAIQQAKGSSQRAVFTNDSVADQLESLDDDNGEGDYGVLSTGDPGLDELLGGGIQPGTLTEIAGEASSGKTAFALQLSLRVQSPVPQGGLSGSCAYLCSEGNFPSSRLLSLASAMSQTREPVESLMNGIQLLHCPEVESMLHAIRYSLPSLVEQSHGVTILSKGTSSGSVPDLSTQFIPSTYPGETMTFDSFDPAPAPTRTSFRLNKPIRAIIVDSIAAPFRGAESSGSRSAADEGTSSQHLTERTRDLAEIASLLLKLAQKYKLAVILVNQVSDVFTTSDRRAPTSVDSVGSHRSPNAYDLYGEDDHRDSLRDIPLHYRPYSYASRFFSGESAGKGGKMAVFGLAWTNLINTRVMLSRTGRRRRIADGSEVLAYALELDGDGGEVNLLDPDSEEIRRMDIVMSPFCELGHCQYVLREEGLVSVRQVVRLPRLGVLNRGKRKSKARDNSTGMILGNTVGDGSSRAALAGFSSSSSSQVDEEAALWQGLGSDPPLEDNDLAV